MDGTLDELIRDLRTFEDRREVTREVRAELRTPVRTVRKAIRARAMVTLPTRGGLNRWVAQVQVSALVRVSGRSAKVTLQARRDSLNGRTDVAAIDRGRLRAPSWGRRGPGDWHNQRVPAGFFTKPATETDAWHEACVRAVDNAFDTIRRG